jgi:hypothetical protein
MTNKGAVSGRPFSIGLCAVLQVQRHEPFKRDRPFPSPGTECVLVSGSSHTNRGVPGGGARRPGELARAQVRRPRSAHGWPRAWTIWVLRVDGWIAVLFSVKAMYADSVMSFSRAPRPAESLPHMGAPTPSGGCGRSLSAHLMAAGGTPVSIIERRGRRDCHRHTSSCLVRFIPLRVTRDGGFSEIRHG